MSADTIASDFVKNFHAAAISRDIKNVSGLIADDVVFHTPRFLRPITDRKHMLIVIKGIIDHVEGFEYHRTFASGREAVMEFKGTLNGVTIHGVDIFTINDDGRATELTVMIRPTKALEAIGAMEDEFFKRMAGQPASAAP